MNSAFTDVLERSRAFFQRSNQPVLPLLEQIASYTKRKSFRICIVGGFSRGKSHFINLLLEMDLLPEAAVPTTGCLTEIAYSDRPYLEIVRNSNIEKTSLESASLDSFSLYRQNAADIILRIYLPAPFLKNGIVLVDTPGVEDVSAANAEITYNALQNADAAIVMVSALAPLSMTEQAFITEYMLDRQIPLMAFAISYCDQIDKNKVPSQLEYIIKKCSRLYSSSLPLFLPVFPNDSFPGFVCGLDAIRQFIVNWSNVPALQCLKMSAALVRIKLLVETELSSLAGAKELLKGDTECVREQIHGALADLEDGSDALIEMRIGFLTKVETLQDQIRKKLNNFRKAYLAGGIEGDTLAIATQLYQELVGQIRISLQADLENLAENLAKTYNLPTNPASFTECSFSEMPVTKLGAHSSGNNPFIEELLNRALILSETYICRLPSGAALWPILRPLINEIMDKARNMCGGNAQKAMKKNLSTICSQISRSLGNNLREIYRQVFEQARQQRKAWLNQQKEAITNASGIKAMNANLSEMDKLIETGGQLCMDIQKLMEGLR